MTEPGPGCAPVDRGGGSSREYALCELVEVTAVPASSVHHYRRLGLIPEPRRLSANRFVYDQRHVAALSAIRSLRQRGLTLDEIRRSLPALVVDTGSGAGAAVDPLLVSRVADASPTARLIDAVLRTSSAHGFGDMSVVSLCSDAGVAKATFYRCFGSKDALFVAAAAAAIERTATGFAAEIAQHDVDPAMVFARCLRPSLPVLLELAKRAIQEPAVTAAPTMSLFAGLADHVGRAVGCGGDAELIARAGGVVIVMAVVKIFGELLRNASPG
jgi:AcrR family transcriptional regulator